VEVGHGHNTVQGTWPDCSDDWADAVNVGTLPFTADVASIDQATGHGAFFP
jgi:hypothetical protein